MTSQEPSEHLRGKRTIHLVCNAHLDPKWQWDWDEAVAEAISTFRVAADLCEQFSGFVFNHNESFLYRCVEEHDPALFRRIRELVRAGKWHIAGGWYLQPDCNMPAAESLIRHILTGKRYFRDRFGVDVTTAYNFDSFGHGRGLVQSLTASGYDSYIHCRPAAGQTDPELPARLYRWQGYAGAEVMALRPYGWYGTSRGEAAKQVESIIEQARGDGAPAVLVLWGIGNHGGGPSRQDLLDLRDLMERCTDADIRHSTPEAFFEAVRPHRQQLPAAAHDLERCFPGCYTSQALLKREHRRLEGLFFDTERMATQAWANGLIPYPKAELEAALSVLMLSQFHDVLCGTCVPEVESASLRELGEGIAICNRVRARSFFALARAEAPAADGEIPVFVANTQPRAVDCVLACEVSMADIRWGEGFFDVRVRQNGRAIPAQVEHEAGNVNVEWRKKVAFAAALAPSCLNRFDLVFTPTSGAAPEPRHPTGPVLHLETDRCELEINTRTGLLGRLRVGGQEMLRPGAFRLVCLDDDEDPWGTYQHRFSRRTGSFRLASAKRARQLQGRDPQAAWPVTIVEDGPVRTVIDAIFTRGDSHAVLRYVVPRTGAWFDVELWLYSFEKRTMIKLEMPLAWEAEQVLCQTVGGREERRRDGSEQVAQRWVAAVQAAERSAALAVINDGTYAFDAGPRRLRLNLLRSPAYTFLPLGRDDRPDPHRFQPRTDQGLRCFRFRVLAGERLGVLDRLDAEAQTFNEGPYILPYFPGTPSEGTVAPLVEVDDPGVLVLAAKKAEDGDDLVVRVQEATGRARRASIRLLGAIARTVSLQPHEIATLRCTPGTGTVRPVNLLEED